MPSSSDEGRLSFADAEAARKAGAYAVAGRAFHVRWSETADAEAGWRYIYCLRKAGYAEAGLRLAAIVLARWPRHEMVRSERVWCLYAARLQPAVAADDEIRILAAADEMIAAGASDLSLRLAVFAAAGAAKRKGHWRQVGAWCDRLDPDLLETEGRRGERGRLPSEQERWYLAKMKSLLELGSWLPLLDLTVRALATFPAQVDFQRWRARALLECGQAAEAVAMVTPWLAGRRRPWYVLADACSILARVEGQAPQALQAGLAALREPAEDPARVSLLLVLAGLSLQCGRAEDATCFLGWCMALRRQQKWPLGPDHERLRQEIEQRGGPVLSWSAEPAEWKRRCLELVGSQAVRGRGGAPATAVVGRPAANAGSADRGRLEGVQAGGTFAFIHAGDVRIFVLLKDVPEGIRRNGARVRFRVVKSFDRKKNREGLRAVEVVADEGG